jgi:RNA polymerase sigma factor for flagellar operon FliA
MVMNAEQMERRRREEMVRSFAPIVEKLAFRVKRRVPDHVEFDELRSVGYMGLMEAIERYDDDKNVPFRVYAEIRINGAMLDYLRKEDWMPRNLRQQAKEIQQAEAEMHFHGEAVTDEGIAKRLSTSIKNVQQLKSATQRRTVLSSSVVVGDSEVRFLEECVSARGQDVLENLIGEEKVELVHEAMQKLSYRERVVVEMYFLQSQNLRQIGTVLGVTESRACQLRKSGIEKLQRTLSQVDC